MNILIINDHGLYGGGTENRIRIFAEYLIKEKRVEQIHVLQRHSSPKSLDMHMPNIFFHTLQMNQSGYTATKNIIKKHKIMLVQVHNLVSIKPYVILAAKQAHIPVLWWVHDYWLLCAHRSFISPYHASQEKLCQKANMMHCNNCMTMKTRVKHLFWKKVMNLCDAAIAPSFVLQQIHEHEGILKGKWKCVTPWIDSLFLSNKQTDITKKKKKEKILLFAGSLIEFKGAWVAARALKYVVKKFPDTILIFVGGDQEPESIYRQNIEKILRTDGTKGHVLFLGKKEKEDLIKIYHSADIFLCPTVCMESFGQTWAEAMASGIPVVASAVGSIPEYIKNKKNGILFSSADEKALAGEVISLLDDPLSAKQIAQCGKRWVQQNCDPEQRCAEIVTIVDELLQQSKF